MNIKMHNKNKYTFTISSHPPVSPSPPSSCLSTTHNTLIYPTPSNPSPPTNNPIFTDAMHVRHQVFVVEQHCSADAEIDADDVRSWEWVVYAHGPRAGGEDDEKEGEEEEEEEEEEEKEAEAERHRPLPVGVVRLVPPPHAPHESPHSGGNNEGSVEWDLVREPYVKITRVAIMPAFRGYGLARLLMRAVEDWAREHRDEIDYMYSCVAGKEDCNDQIRLRWNGLIGLHAQVQVEAMYAALGYETDQTMGKWDEEGIEHVGMFKRVFV